MQGTTNLLSIELCLTLSFQILGFRRPPRVFPSCFSGKRSLLAVGKRNVAAQLSPRLFLVMPFRHLEKEVVTPELQCR